MVFMLPDVARYLMKETRYGDFMEPEDMSPALPEADRVEEFSDLFNARYIDAARQIHAFFEKHGMCVLIYPVDEPRERNTNRWNRNLADTLRYSKLIREHVPGARIYVDPMRDDNSRRRLSSDSRRCRRHRHAPLGPVRAHYQARRQRGAPGVVVFQLHRVGPV